MPRPATASDVSDRAPARSFAWTQAIARGDETAFAQFYEVWFDRAFALARSFSKRDESFCLDVVQDAMLRVVRSIPALSNEAAVESWMARTVVTTAIDQLRAEHRRTRRERHAAQRETEDAPQEDAVLSGEQIEWLRSRIGDMPERDRRLLRARFESDRTLAAAGAAVGLSGNAAHGRIRRLVMGLRRAATEVFGD